MNNSAFTKWFDQLGKAWISRDPDMAADICTEDVLYYEDPFQKPYKGRTAVRKIWEEVPKTQKDIRFTHEMVSVVGHLGIAHWSASYTKISNDERVELDGVFIVRLNEQGLCQEFHMWWNKKA